MSKSPLKQQRMQETILHLLRVQVVEAVTPKDCFLRTDFIFFNGTQMQQVLYLKFLKQFIHHQKFRIESLFIGRALCSLNLPASVDLEEAYLHMPNHLQHREVLRFPCSRNHFQF